MSNEQSFSAATPVEIKLLLDDGSSRHIEASPEGIAFGALRLRRWQVFPIEPVPARFADWDSYLVKINYDFLLEPDTPGPAWFEIGFILSAPGSDGRATVIDAVPRRVSAAQDPTSFDLDDYLAFVPGSGVHLPATDPTVHLFGLGGSEVRWRHTAANSTGVQPGAYTSWTTLTVPVGCRRLSVDVAARFDLDAESEEAQLYSPASESSTIALHLDTPQAYSRPHVPPGNTESVVTAGQGPRIFVSYAHDDDKHCEAVLRLSSFLVTEYGFDVHMDRWDLDRRRDWFLWAIGQVTAADFVIVIASPQCKRVADGLAGNLDHRGMQSEMSLLRELLHSDRETWLRKLLPVVLPDRAVGEIPLFLQPSIADHYLVTDYTHAAMNDLVGVITRQPPHRRPSGRGRCAMPTPDGIDPPG